MTVATEYEPQRYTGNGVTTTFAFPYIFFDATDLIVTLTLISTGANTVQVLNTDYTVTGGNGAVGNVVFTVAPSSLYRVTIELSLPYTQQDDYVENQAFPADTLESGLDRAAIRDQQLRSLITGSLKFPATLASSYDGLLPAPENGKILIWSGITGQVANASLADISISLNTIITSPTSGQVLTWNGTNWVNAAITIPDGSITTNKIVDATITEAKLGTGSVSTRVLNDASIIWSKFSSGVLATTAEIASGTTQKLIAADKLLPFFYGCKTYQTTGTAIATSTWTTVLFDTESWDDDTWHSTSSNTERHTFNFTGRVEVKACYATNAIDNASYGVRIRKNGTTVARIFVASGAVAAEVTQVMVSTELDVVSTDYVDTQVFQSSGLSKTTQTGVSGTTLSSRRIK